MYSLSRSSTGNTSRRSFVKPSRPYLVLAALIASALSAGSVLAGTGCPDDPERCVERGATVSHRTVAVAPVTNVSVAPATVKMAPAVAAAKPAPVKKSQKPARVTPVNPAPATPGMGMLLKLSNGSGGEVSLFPSKPSENSTGASWVL